MYGEHIMEHYESCSIETIKNALITYANMRVIHINKTESEETVTVLLSDDKVRVGCNLVNGS